MIYSEFNKETMKWAFIYTDEKIISSPPEYDLTDPVQVQKLIEWINEIPLKIEKYSK